MTYRFDVDKKAQFNVWLHIFICSNDSVKYEDITSPIEALHVILLTAQVLSRR